MPGTLAMHVVKGDQDYASILGNDFMRNHKIDRVTVLTHCDKLDGSNKDGVSRFQDTLSKTSEISSMTFAVHGSAQTQDEEEGNLEHLRRFQDANFDIGAMQLGKHLEERLHRHVENQLHLAATNFQKSLEETTLQLQNLQQKSPSHLITTLTETIRENFKVEKKVLMNNVRDQVHEMAMAIRNYLFCPAKDDTPQDRDAFEEDLEPGMHVWTALSATCIQCVTITAVRSTAVDWKRYSSVGPTSGSTPIRSLRSGEVSSVANIIEEIKKLAHDRGHRNLIHVDRQPIIQVYAKRFADHYTMIFAQHRAVVQALVKKALDTSFSRNVDAAAYSVAQQLREEQQASLETAKQRTEAAFKMIEEHNTNPELVFTTNEHYLNDLVQKMVAADTCTASDAGSARHIYHNIRAYLKVQRKQVALNLLAKLETKNQKNHPLHPAPCSLLPALFCCSLNPDTYTLNQVAEQAAKELIRTAVLDVETNLKKLLAGDMSDFHEMLGEELPSITKKREMLKKRQAVLRQAVKLLPLHPAAATRRSGTPLQ